MFVKLFWIELSLIKQKQPHAEIFLLVEEGIMATRVHVRWNNKAKKYSRITYSQWVESKLEPGWCRGKYWIVRSIRANADRQFLPPFVDLLVIFLYSLEYHDRAIDRENPEPIAWNSQAPLDIWKDLLFTSTNMSSLSWFLSLCSATKLSNRYF